MCLWRTHRWHSMIRRAGQQRLLTFCKSFCVSLLLDRAALIVSNATHRISYLNNTDLQLRSRSSCAREARRLLDYR
jgi:hypothetical protein